MSTEQEKKIQYLMDQMVQRASKREAAEAILAIPGVDITPPPEPEWKPGQVAWIRFGAGGRVLAERSHQDGWWVVGSGEHFTDEDRITDIERVAVLTVGDADDLLKLVDLGDVPEAFRFFRERGLDL